MEVKINKYHDKINIKFSDKEVDNMINFNKDMGRIQFKAIDRNNNQYLFRFTEHNEVVLFQNDRRILCNSFYPIENSIIKLKANCDAFEINQTITINLNFSLKEVK